MVSEDVRAACEAHVGRERVIRDSLAPENAQKLATLLERNLPETLPTTWHWAYFNPAIPVEDVGHDGHERLGVFMPPAPFARRMWAGGTVELLRPLQLGRPAEKRSRIENVAFKTGASGDLCFVTVAHEIAQDGIALRETQTIVYRDRGLSVTSSHGWEEAIPEGHRVVPDTSLLAYSAITQNGHRIHWDRDFCRDVEGYPGLVVHGPLLATYLADALVPNAKPSVFTYRAKAPVFEGMPFQVVTNGTSAEIVRADGQIAMGAEIA